MIKNKMIHGLIILLFISSWNLFAGGNRESAGTVSPMTPQNNLSNGDNSSPLIDKNVPASLETAVFALG
jgi:hypothetical protein